MKIAYALCSNDFSIVDGSLLFMPEDGSYSLTGYVSSVVADEDGNFTTNPIITISLESSYSWYGMAITFRNTYPSEFTIRTYNDDGELVDTKSYTDITSADWITSDKFNSASKIEIEFTKGYPNARVVVDYVSIADSTDYELSENDLYSPITVKLIDKLNSITVNRTVYSTTSTSKELQSEEVVVNSTNNTINITLTNASYDYSVSVEQPTFSDSETATYVTATIVSSGCYHVSIQFDGLPRNDVSLKYTLTGKEYSTVTSDVHKTYSNNGSNTVSWNNPLVSTAEMATDILDWLEQYYKSNVEYQLSWRGDPRVDAGDFFKLIKDGQTKLIQSSQNDLNFNGAWSGTITARKAVQ